MTRTLALAALLLLAARLALACSNGDGTDDLMGPCAGEPGGQCVMMPGVMELCGGDKPTIWLNPKLEPRDAANRLLGAFEALGYLPVEKKP